MINKIEKNRIKVQIAAIKQFDKRIDEVLKSNPSKEMLMEFLMQLQSENKFKLEKRYKRLRLDEINSNITELKKKLERTDLSEKERSDLETELGIELNRKKVL